MNFPALDRKEYPLSFGYHCDLPEHTIVWGARGIYEWNRATDRYSIELLFDRQGAKGHEENPAEWEKLNKWLKGALKQIEDKSESPRSDNEIKLNEDKNYLIASPNSSYGYMYITAYRIP